MLGPLVTQTSKEADLSTEVLVSPARHNKTPQAGGSNHKIIFSQLWNLEVQDHGASGLVFGEVSPPGLETTAFPLCPHVAGPRPVLRAHMQRVLCCLILLPGH